MLLILACAGVFVAPGLRTDRGEDTVIVKRACRTYQRTFGALPTSMGQLHCLASEPRIPHYASGKAYYRLVRGRERLFLAWGREGSFELRPVAWLE